MTNLWERQRPTGKCTDISKAVWQPHHICLIKPWQLFPTLACEHPQLRFLLALTAPKVNSVEWGLNLVGKQLATPQAICSHILLGALIVWHAGSVQDCWWQFSPSSLHIALQHHESQTAREEASSSVLTQFLCFVIDACTLFASQGSPCSSGMEPTAEAMAFGCFGVWGGGILCSQQLLERWATVVTEIFLCDSVTILWLLGVLSSACAGCFHVSSRAALTVLPHDCINLKTPESWRSIMKPFYRVWSEPLEGPLASISSSASGPERLRAH